jgi:hypothetical protein
MIREDGLSNTRLATRLLQIAETFRSVAIDPVVAAVRAVVDVTGTSGIKAMSEVTIGMKVRTVGEGQAIFHDDYAAAQQLAKLKERGMFIPKVGSQLHPPVHGYNITDGTDDDGGHPTEDRITPIVMAVSDPQRRAEPEQLVKDAMGEAYANRWEQPHIKQLMATWKREAGIRDREPAVARDDDDDSPFDVWERQFDDSEIGLDDDEPGYEMNPKRKRMYELLIERGTRGYQPNILQGQLGAEGLEVHRGTLMKWLAEAVRLGYVYQSGKPKSRSVRYVWILGEGAEFEIPGWR